jgi:hypothetical protein
MSVLVFFIFSTKYNYFHILKDKINITLSEEFFYLLLFYIDFVINLNVTREYYYN